jgi:hypothetical protein
VTDQQTADDFLNESGGPPAAKFPNIGSEIEGDVLAARVGTARKFGTREPDTWEDGTPKQQLIVDLRTGDGDLRLYCKEALRVAIREAVQASGGRLADGGRLKVKRTEDGAATKAGFNPPQQFKARFTPKPVNIDEEIDF